jgi:serine/threonine protein kinase
MMNDTQGWPTNFGDTDVGLDIPLVSGSSRKLYQSNELTDIMVAMRHELAFIPSFRLVDCGRLGQGSSFEVSKAIYTAEGSDMTPYVVAVKRVSTRRNYDGTDQTGRNGHGQSRDLINVMREIRVLTHPELREHGALVPAIGWGWMTDPWAGPLPYLVMQYSDKGSLATFSKQRSVSWGERQLLAHDVALGLRALHDCGIVHGDIKPENVLVYDSIRREDDWEDHRPFVAKLADFGCAMFEADFDIRDECYLGTPKYNAPEVSGLLRDGGGEGRMQLSKLDRFKAADCYSFGLLLWETVKQGNSFVEPSWLMAGENAVEFLQRLFHTKEDALLTRAIEFFNEMQASNSDDEDESYDVAPFIRLVTNPTRSQLVQHVSMNSPNVLVESGTPSNETAFEAFRQTASLCLRDKLRERGRAHDIVKVLSQEVR